MRYCCPASCAPLLLTMLALLCLTPFKANAQALASLTLSPVSGFGGSINPTGTVTLSAATTVTLASSNQTSLAVPASVSVATGSTTATFSAVSHTVTASYNGGSKSGTVTVTAGGNAAPTVATPASATPSPATGTTTTFSVQGADDGGAANLTYT